MERDIQLMIIILCTTLLLLSTRHITNTTFVCFPPPTSLLVSGLTLSAPPLKNSWPLLSLSNLYDGLWKHQLSFNYKSTPSTQLLTSSTTTSIFIIWFLAINLLSSSYVLILISDLPQHIKNRVIQTVCHGNPVLDLRTADCRACKGWGQQQQ